MNKKMDTEPGVNSPKTIPEIGIHIGFMWQKLDEIQADHKNDHAILNKKLEELVDKSPSRTEFDELKKEVSLKANSIDKQQEVIDSLKGDRKWLMGAAAVLILLQGALLLLARLYIANEVQASVKNALSSYNIQIN